MAAHVGTNPLRFWSAAHEIHFEGTNGGAEGAGVTKEPTCGRRAICQRNSKVQSEEEITDS